MSETQQLLEKITELEGKMKEFDTLSKEVMSSIAMEEFLDDNLSTDIMKCIMELTSKQKEIYKIYTDAGIGENPPKRLVTMREQIQKYMKEQKKIDYMETVKTDFLSLHSDDASVQSELQEFKDKIVDITPDKYPMEKCLVYMRPFAVFISMIKSPGEYFDQVPILMEYFGSDLVAHITVSKDILLGENAVDFDLEEEKRLLSEDDDSGFEGENADIVHDASVENKGEVSETDAEALHDTSADNAQAMMSTPKPVDYDEIDRQLDKNESEVEVVELVPEAPIDLGKPFDPYEGVPTEQEINQAGSVENSGSWDALPPMDITKSDEEDENLNAPQANEMPLSQESQLSSRPATPKPPRKVDLKALLEEDNFSESKLDDPELNNSRRRGRKGRKSTFLNPSGVGKL